MANGDKRNLIYNLIARTKQWKKGFKEAGKSVKTLHGRFKKFRESNTTLGRLTKRLTSLTAALSAAGAAAFAVGRGMLKGARDAVSLEAAYSNINTLIAGPGGLKNSTKDFIVEMAKTYGKTAQENAKAYYDIVSSGTSDQTVANQILEAANKSALAGVADLSSMVKILTGAVNAYGSEVLSASRAGDVFQAIVEQGVVTAPELTQGFGQLMAIAAPAGIAIEEVGAMVSALTAKSVPAAQAMTAVKGILGSIVKKEGKDAIPVLEKIGFQWDVNTAKSMGLVNMIKKASKAIGENTEDWQRLSPEMESSAALMALSANNAEDLGNKLDKIKDSQGKVSEAAKDQTNTQLKLAQATERAAEAWRLAGEPLNQFRILLKDVSSFVGRMIAGIVTLTKKLLDFFKLREWTEKDQRVADKLAGGGLTGKKKAQVGKTGDEKTAETKTTPTPMGDTKAEVKTNKTEVSSGKTTLNLGSGGGSGLSVTAGSKPTAADARALQNTPAGIISKISSEDMDKFFSKLKPELGKLAQKDQIDNLITAVKSIKIKAEKTKASDIDKDDSEEEDEKKVATLQTYNAENDRWVNINNSGGLLQRQTIGRQ